MGWTNLFQDRVLWWAVMVRLGFCKLFEKQLSASEGLCTIKAVVIVSISVTISLSLYIYISVTISLSLYIYL